ncbi:hypothetical protein BJ508DRAFT_367188 [Ascobolus immersus RN42]|uniref:C2H2-type domain-containing protein n=1 Tax=Ascobolus immersus RN42 TaxID=1160509 RepID=A0A3N4HEB8_ASCIM|nr:hypothetical protein BJ508DRAFT_367188 [Ascobolus immersus RN42]
MRLNWPFQPNHHHETSYPKQTHQPQQQHNAKTFPLTLAPRPRRNLPPPPAPPPPPPPPPPPAETPPPPAPAPRLTPDPTTTPIITCTLPPHPPLTFTTHSAYTSHYASTHTNRCSTCHLNFPSTHYLTLHIRENHDPLVMVQWERGEKVYMCYVEGCEKVCKDRGRRRLHCRDGHGFPENFNWAVVDHGVDGATTLLRSGWPAKGPGRGANTTGDGGEGQVEQQRPPKFNHVSTLPKPKMHIRFHEEDGEGDTKMKEEEQRSSPAPKVSAGCKGDVDINNILKGMSAMALVPRSVQLKKKGH